MNSDFLINDEISRLSKEVLAAKQRLSDAIRRAAPEPVEDVTLQRTDGSPVRLAELFAGKPDLIIWHNMGRKCVYCTLWADGLRGYAEHLMNRAGFALCSPDDPRTLKEFSESRGWRFPCVSAAGTTFLKAMKMCDDKGDPWPGISAFHKENQRIVRTGYTYFGPGDDFCPIWPALDLLKQGHNGWSPKFSYQPDVTTIGTPTR
ncbi:MAG: DUF899 family protein [Phycisphaerae bacterium]|nr:DUF899 family protein [Phycisphaerae bacterium]